MTPFHWLMRQQGAGPTAQVRFGGMNDPIPFKLLHPERLLDLSSQKTIDPLLLDLTPVTESEVPSQSEEELDTEKESPENTSATGGQKSKP